MHPNCLHRIWPKAVVDLDGAAAIFVIDLGSQVTSKSSLHVLLDIGIAISWRKSGEASTKWSSRSFGARSPAESVSVFHSLCSKKRGSIWHAQWINLAISERWPKEHLLQRHRATNGAAYGPQLARRRTLQRLPSVEVSARLQHHDDRRQNRHQLHMPTPVARTICPRHWS